MTARTAILIAAVALLWGGYLFMDAARDAQPRPDPASAEDAPGE